MAAIVVMVLVSVLVLVVVVEVAVVVVAMVSPPVRHQPSRRCVSYAPPCCPACIDGV